LRKGDDVPQYPDDFKDKFIKFWEDINVLSDRCFDLISLSKDDKGDQYMDDGIIKVVKNNYKRKSSISMIHYYPRPPPDERDESLQTKGADDEDGFNVPSRVHTDTGLLTLISCAEVPGLQVENRENGEFIEVEKLFDPRRDIFVIIGRKMTFFAKNEPSCFKPTVHRVMLPYNIERYSMLYFVDVPQ